MGKIFVKRSFTPHKYVLLESAEKPSKKAPKRCSFKAFHNTGDERIELYFLAPKTRINTAFVGFVVEFLDKLHRLHLLYPRGFFDKVNV